MNKQIAVLTLCAVLFVLNFPVEAQQLTKVPRIGYLSPTSPSVSPTRIEAFRQGLRELGYVEGKNIVIEYRYAEGKFGVKLQYLEVRGLKGIETAFRAASKERAEAVLYLVAGLVDAGRQTEITEFALKSRLPAIYRSRQYVEAGGLVSYGVSVDDLDRRAATYVDKILKGRTPADLPVEQPTKFDFVINLKAAKQIGLTIPPNVLVRADKVIR